MRSVVVRQSAIVVGPSERVASPLKPIVEIRFPSWNCGRIKEKRLKTKIQITRTLGTKTQPDSAFQPSVTNIEEQGILESFARLPQAEREIIRQLLDEFGTQRVAAIRFPVLFGPKRSMKGLDFFRRSTS